MPYGITQCYLPPGRGDVPALIDRLIFNEHITNVYALITKQKLQSIRGTEKNTKIKKKKVCHCGWFPYNRLLVGHLMHRLYQIESFSTSVNYSVSDPYIYTVNHKNVTFYFSP